VPVPAAMEVTELVQALPVPVLSVDQILEMGYPFLRLYAEDVALARNSFLGLHPVGAALLLVPVPAVSLVRIVDLGQSELVAFWNLYLYVALECRH